MDRKLHLLETFHAEDEQGTPYKVCGYEHMVRVPLAVAGGASEQWEPTGVAEYRLDSGEHLDQAVDGSLHLAGSGVRLTRTTRTTRLTRHPRGGAATAAA